MDHIEIWIVLMHSDTRFNAMNSSFLGKDIAKEFGNAHECLNRDVNHPEHVAGNMDLFNNNMGYTIYGYLIEQGIIIQGPKDAYKLADEICRRLENGDLKVFIDPNNQNSTLIPSSNCNCN